MNDYIPVEPKPVLKPGLHLGDNGRCFCERHAGISALYTGRDLSGQKVHRITPRDVAAWQRDVGRLPACEDCQADARAAARSGR